MIAAPDVVARTIDPGDDLRWLTGPMDKLFVTSGAALEAKLAALDRTPDPDGRYRVNAFCCGATTWQATVVALMDRADAVVMDLRGVTRDRHGCALELQQLAERFPPGASCLWLTMPQTALCSRRVWVGNFARCMWRKLSECVTPGRSSPPC